MCCRFLESRLLEHPEIKEVAVRGIEVEGVGTVKYSLIHILEYHLVDNFVNVGRLARFPGHMWFWRRVLRCRGRSSLPGQRPGWTGSTGTAGAVGVKTTF